MIMTRQGRLVGRQAALLLVRFRRIVALTDRSVNRPFRRFRQTRGSPIDSLAPLAKTTNPAAAGRIALLGYFFNASRISRSSTMSSGVTAGAGGGA
jgi:hypothetical protein